MKNYKNNLRRNRYRNNGDRNYIRNGSGQKINSEFTNSSNFRRRYPGKNNINASQLIEKYTTLAKEALTNGDKILSESYFQHADHFIRVIGDKMKEKNLDTKNNIDKNRIESENKETISEELKTNSEIV